MSDAQTALGIEDETWHRLSPRMLLIHPVMEIGRAFPALIGLFFAGGTGGRGGYFSLIGAGVVAAYALTRWFTTRLRITPTNIQLRHGLLRRRTVSASRERVRTVDVTSHLLHRILGLARVAVGTGTNDRSGEGRIALDGLTVDQATQLRDDLLHRAPAATAPSSETAIPPDEDDVLAVLEHSWIRYAPFTLSGAVSGLVLWGLFWRIQGESGIDLTKVGPLRPVSHWLDRLSTTTLVLVIVLAVLVFVVVTSVAGYILAFWNFRLVRGPGGTLQVTRGLITTRATSIERARLDGAELAEPLLLRAVGAMRLLVVATGLRTGRSAERGGEILLPPAPADTARAVARTVLDNTTAVDATLEPAPSSARRRHLTRALSAGVLVLALGLLARWWFAPTWVAVVAAMPLIAAIPLGLDRYASLGHTLADGYLVTRFGSLARRTSVVHGDAVIGWNIATTFFQRRLGLATLTATTAAGRQGYSVVDADPVRGLLTARDVTPELIEQFRLDRR